MKIVVFQKGAREHFLVARVLNAKGNLAQLVVDWSPLPFRWLLRMLSGFGLTAARRALGAFPSGIPPHLICALNWTGLVNKLKARIDRRSSRMKRDAEADRRFGHKASRLGLPEHGGVFAYSYAALEILQRARCEGKLALLGQIDPGIAERKIVLEEEEKWPDYVRERSAITEEYESRNREELEVADGIIVNSEWSKRCLESEGVDPTKIYICPLAYEVKEPGGRTRAKRGAGDPLRVLWLGAVSVRKGFPYVVEAAKELGRESYQIDVYGGIEISENAAAEASKWLTLHGPVPRTEIGKIYGAADVFVLPTVSDGFAITQVEALGHGLPVIATSRCGDVVTDGFDGFRIDACSSKALRQALEALHDDRGLLTQMSRNAVESSKRFSHQCFLESLEIAIRDIRSRVTAAGGQP